MARHDAPGGPWGPGTFLSPFFLGPSRGIRALWGVTPARFFCAKPPRLGRPYKVTRHYWLMPRDAQALAIKRANRRRPLDKKSKKIVPRISYGMRNTVTTSDISSAFLPRSFLFFFSLVSSLIGNP